ncbi:MAG TPA: Hsp20/alpha crystallin family protein [Candidatus Thermoplasmatota archaeon]|nr:Hsp20/alpha crystallin family protein [Candidatus Thermoplasmatota archaeon]
MQTETRSSKKDDGTIQRRERPRQFDAGIRETSAGPQFEAWGAGQQVPNLPYQGYQGHAGGFQQSGFVAGYAPQAQPFGTPFAPQVGGYGQNLVNGQGAAVIQNPFTAIAPTLSYGLAGLADLLYRGVALATSQGQALINTIYPQPSAQRQAQTVAWPSARLPATDIVDEGAELVCQIELPGVKSENVEVSCFGRSLLVTAYSESEIDLGALVQAERGIEATYRRAINLPVPVQPSGTKATLRDGILTVNLPKANPTEAPRRIPVTSTN